MPPHLSRALRLFGIALALGASYFVLLRLWTESTALPEGVMLNVLPRLLTAAALYAAAGALLGVIWWIALRLSGAGKLPIGSTVAASMASQIGKYLPGNVAHFVARHALGHRHGASHAQLVAATLVDSLVLVAAAAVFAVMIVDRLRSHPPFSGLPVEGLWIAPLLAMLLVPIGLVSGRHLGWLDSGSGHFRLAGELGAALVVGILFFVASAGIFVLMSSSLDVADLPELLPWLAAAWLLGFVLPGAPGGLGVRELVLAFGLAPTIGDGPAALDAVLFRVVTLGGDALMSLVGCLFLRRI